MTKRALVVGAVPPVIERVLTERGFTVRHAGATDIPTSAVDLAVVHEEARESPAAYAGVSAWLETLRGDEVTTVLQAGQFTEEIIVRRLIVHRITHVIEGSDPTPAQVTARIALAEGQPMGVIGTGDLRLGDYYRSEVGIDGQDAYEDRRSLSMVSPSLWELVDDINFAVQRMAGTSEGDPWPPPPWDPHEQVASRLDTRGDHLKLDNRRTLPRLSDLYSLPGDLEARKLLGATAEAIAKARQTHVQANMALIRGESGSGKTLAASLMWKGFAASTEWARDDYRKMPFVKVNCGGMTAENFDHFMLGAGPGQFTDVKCRVGHFGRADYGVLFLDEIGDMDASAQSRFKPLLDDLIIEPPGLFAYPLHTRVIAATNVDLESADRGFQHDLLRRFNIPIRVPGLNERTDSEKLLQVDFVAQLPTINPRDASGLKVKVVDAAVVDVLLAHDWAHGNFRELQEVVQGGVTSAKKRRSRRVELRDITFSPKNVPGDERVVNVADATVGQDLPTIRVRERSDLVRASQLLGQPVFRLPDRSEVVVSDGYRLASEPPAGPGAATSG